MHVFLSTIYIQRNKVQVKLNYKHSESQNNCGKKEKSTFPGRIKFGYN
jgi:hypothetical protein